MDLAHVLHDTHLFQDPEPGQLAPLVTQVRRVELRRAEHLWEEGDTATALYVVVSGQVKIFRIGLSGGQIITQVAAAGDVFGHPGLFIPGERRGTNAESMEHSVCLAATRRRLFHHFEDASIARGCVA